MTFRKYELTPTQWATAKKKIQITNEEGSYWNPELVAVLYEIGKLCLETDEEGNCVKQSTKISVDIVWANEPLKDFNTYLVWPLPVGVSSMGYTMDTDYANAYCFIHPEYCQTPTNETTDNI